MTQIINYMSIRWPNLIITALYAVPVFIYRFLVAPKYEYPKRLLGFAVLFVLLFFAWLACPGEKLMIIWFVEHAIVLLLHYIFWLRNIIKKLPIGYPESGYVTLALAFLVQFSQFLIVFVGGNIWGWQ